MIRLPRLLAIGFILTNLLLPGLQVARAQDKVSTTISPPLFELTANPGDTLQKSMKVTNASDVSVSYQMEVETFVGNELGQATVTDNDDPAYSLKSMTTISPTAFTLASKETKTVTFTIVVPKNAAPGGRYGTILASVANTDQINGSGAITKQKVGALVLASISGTVSFAATVKNFDVGKRLFERSPINFSTRIHNDSTVHIKPKGFITLSNTFGHKVADIAYDERNILPKSDRLIESNYDQKLPIGRYTATLAVTYGDNNDHLTAVTSFIVFPWKVGVPIIIGTIILLWILIARRKRLAQALRIIFGRSN